MKTTTIVEMTCVNCGTLFGMDETLVELRKDDGKLFHCPNGHGQSYTTSKQEKLEEATKEVAELKEELNDAQVEIRRLKCELMAKGVHPSNTGHALWG